MQKRSATTSAADGAGRTRRATRSSTAKAAAAPLQPIGNVTDIARFLGISDDELTPSVQQGLTRLLAEVDRLRQDLEARERRISHLERLADEDPLTPILNRRAFVRELSRMTAFAERYGAPSSVLYFDVNQMKAINDSHGHAAGDAALTHVANVLLAHIRGSDTVGRLGGDEFGVLLAQTNEETAKTKGAQLKEAIQATPVPWNNQPLHVQVSFGAHSFEGPGEPHDILQAADQAMYRQKRSSTV